MKNLLSIRDLGGEGVKTVLAEAEKMTTHVSSREIAWAWQPLKNTVPPEVFELFLEKSLRTWGSFATAAKFVGFDCRTILGEDQTSIPKGESFANTLRMLTMQQAASILVMRTKWEGAPRFAAELLRDLPVPVINAGDGCNRHPSQTLLDLFTIKRKFGRLNGFVLGFVGDMIHSRTSHDLLEAARIFGFGVATFCSPETRPPKSWLKGVEVVVESDSLAGIDRCDVINVIRLQKERLEGDPLVFQRALEEFRLTRSVLNQRCKKNVLILHAQPIDSAWDILPIEPGIYDDPRIVVHEQAAFGHPVRMAILRLLWKNRKQAEKIPEIEPDKPEMIESRSIDDHQRQLGERRGQYFRPISEGTVIDHLPDGSSKTVLAMLEKMGAVKGGNGPVITAVGLDSKKVAGGKKDALVLEGRSQIPPHILGAIAVFFPGVTFNVCHSGTFQKLRLPAPKMMAAVLPCPNPRCITNNDPEAQTRFWLTDKGEDRGGKSLLCDFCEHIFSPQEILRRFGV